MFGGKTGYLPQEVSKCRSPCLLQSRIGGGPDDPISGCSKHPLPLSCPGKGCWGDLDSASGRRAALRGDWEKAGNEWAFGEIGLRAEARFF